MEQFKVHWSYIPKACKRDIWLKEAIEREFLRAYKKYRDIEDSVIRRVDSWFFMDENWGENEICDETEYFRIVHAAVINALEKSGCFYGSMFRFKLDENMKLIATIKDFEKSELTLEMI